MKCISLKKDKQLNGYYRRWFDLNRIYDSWGWLFKTKNFKRKKRHHIFITDKICSLVIRKYNPKMDDDGKPLWTIKKVQGLGWILFWRGNDE